MTGPSGGSASMLQIGLIASPRQTSGSDRYYFDLVRRLSRDGVALRGLVLGDPSAVGAGPEIESFAPEGTGALVRWPALRRHVRRLAASSDLVVSHFAPHLFPALDVTGDRPVVVHFHGPWALEGRFGGKSGVKVALRYVQERAVYERAARIIVLSRAFGAILREHYGVPESKIRIVPGGVDVASVGTTLAREAARTRLGIARDRRVVVTVRRLESTKGVDRLVEAIDAVRSAVPETLLVVVGTGSMLPRLRALVEVRDLGRHVRFEGLVEADRLPVLFAAADCSVVPSIAFEGFGLVCLESYACGTPVIVTPVGGLPEVLAGFDEASVLPGESVDEIARGLIDALSGRRPLPSPDACRAYADRFDWSSIARRVRDVYDEVR